MKITDDQIHDLARRYAEKTTSSLDHNTKSHPNSLDYLYSRYLFARQQLETKNQGDDK